VAAPNDRSWPAVRIYSPRPKAAVADSNVSFVKRPRNWCSRPSSAIRSRVWSVIRTSAWPPTAVLNCMQVSELTRHEMGTGGNITVLPADAVKSQDSSRLCSEAKGYLGTCILQTDPLGRVGFLIISLLIACTRRQTCGTLHAPRRPAPARKNLDAPSKSAGPSLLFNLSFPNLIGQARSDESW
jgi:hypothetical protein